MRRALTVTASCLAIAACGDSTAPPVATSLEIVAAGTQTATAGKLVPQAPSFVVKDQGGNPMAGAPVSVVVSAGGGTVTGAPTQSSAGPTSIGQWTLGQTVAHNRVTVSAGGLPSLTFTAEGVAGPVAKVNPIGTASFTGRIGGTLEPGPRALVADEFDNPIAGVTVTIETGGGSTAPVTTMVTDANGAIMVPQWVLGAAQGQYTLTVSAGSLSTVFTATATSGPPASISVLEGGSQAAPAATPLSAPLRLKVEDAFGNAVDNELVQFELVAGGGQLESTSAQTNNVGVVTVPPWTMGRTDVPQTVRAVAGTVVQEVTLRVATQFNIDVRFPGAVSPERQAVFARAAQRIQGIITGDIPDIPSVSLDMTQCTFPGETYVGPIDDVVIYAAIVAIDGPGNILGQAGPCWVRSPGVGGLPLIGIMRFDEADIANLETLGRLEDVILHEMFHVLGLGTYWASLGLLQGASSLDVRYTGPLGREGCVQVGGSSICSLTVPVHSCTATTDGQSCQQGTVNSHWRETTFGNELMTGFVSSGSNPLSAMTIGALEDLGYNVNRAPRDDYNIPTAGFQGNVIPGTGTVQPWEMVIRPVGTVDPSGRVTKLAQPQ